MPEPSRNANDYREYDKNAIDKLIFIRRCRELQVPLEQSKQLILVQIDKTASCYEVDKIIEEQLRGLKSTRSKLYAKQIKLSTKSIIKHYPSFQKLNNRVLTKRN